MNQLAASPSAIPIAVCCAMRPIKNNTMAGAIIFRAVPPMVWSALRVMAEKDKSSEKAAPHIAATIRASIISICPCSWPKTLFCCIILTNSTPINAPNIMIPSRARLITPLRSANIPARATIIRGMAYNIVCCIKNTIIDPLLPLHRLSVSHCP